MLRPIFLALSRHPGLARFAPRHPILPRTALRFVAVERLGAGVYGTVGVVIHPYLPRSASDVEGLTALGAGARLVRGAHAEPPSVAFPDKRAADAASARLAEQLLRRGVYPAIATHDER